MVTSASRTAPAALAAPLAVLLAAAVGACTPEIGTGTYFCGPERLCPPEQTCDEPTHTCVNPVLAEPFACPEDTEDFEPDDELAEARDLGGMLCGQQLFGGGFNGCIAGAGKIDVFMLTGNACSGSDTAALSARLRYPTAFVPLQLELLDADGELLATGVPCDVGDDFGGLDGVCLESPVDDAIYYVRVSVDPVGPDCDGGCAQTQYILDIASVLT
jgi:hypothetical protein